MQEHLESSPQKPAFRWKVWALPASLFALTGIMTLLATGPYYTGSLFNLALNTTGSTAQRTFITSAAPLDDGTPTPYARYLVFLFTGDGHYYLDEMPANTLGQASLSITHEYAVAGTYSPLVETCDVYDDKDLPPAKSAPSNITVTGGGTPPPKQNMNGYSVIITPVRKMVSTHALTYIVTYENTAKNDCSISGDVYFRFDSTKLTWETPLTYPGADAVTAPTTPNTGTAKISFTNLAKGVQRNAFLKFTTSGGAQQSVKPPTAQMVIASTSGNCEGISTSPFTLTAHSVVETSHDPNHKTITPAAFCKNESGDLEFLVTFQNDGAAPVKDVRITDILDLPIRSCDTANIQIIDQKPATGQLKYNLRNGRLTAHLSGINMPGLAQAGYGTQFGENDTKGYIKFRVPMSCLSPKYDCSAICNRASIVFDCNPPIETNLALSRLKCGGAAPVAPSSPNLNCIDCTEIDTTLTTLIIDSVGTSLLPGGFGGIDFSPYQLKWYPVEGLSNATVLNPTLTQVRNRTYTLVASRQCERIIIHRKVQRNCQVKLTLNAINLLDCSPKYQVQFSATGGNPMHLIWQDCQAGTSHAKNYGPGPHYFSVIDTSTGCYADTTLYLPAETLQLSDNAGDCVGNPVVVNTLYGSTTGPYTYQWEWTDAVGNKATSTQQPPLSLKGKRTVKVTVTDANGCKGTLQISKRWWCDWWPWPWVVVGILVVALGLFFRRRRAR